MVKAALFENGRDSLDLEDDEDEIDLDSLDAGQFRSVLREAVDEGIAEMYARAAGKLPK
jgi:hypothetical protein